MAKTKAPKVMFSSIGAPGETLAAAYLDEEKRVDFLTLSDYRTMLDNDGQIQMLWNAIVNTILSAGVEIQDPNTYENSTPSEEKEFIEKTLFLPEYEGGMSRSLDLTMRTQMRAFVEGFRVFEVVYKLGKDGKVYIDRLAPRAGLNDFDLVLLVDDNGDFMGIRQRTSFKNQYIDLTIKNETEISKIVKATYGQEFGSNYGRSGLKAAWYHYDKAHKGMFLNHVAHELGALKVRYLKHSTNSEDTLSEAVTRLARVAQETVIALDSQTFDLQVLDMSNPETMREGKAMIDLHYSMIAKSVLAQFVDLGSNISSTGSRSLGDVQLAFFKTGLEAVAQTIIEDMWNKVIADLVKVNFNRGIFPRFKIKSISDTKIELLHTLFTEMVKKGAVNQEIANEIQKTVSGDLGLDVADEAFEVEETPAQQPVLPQPNVVEEQTELSDHSRHVHFEEQFPIEEPYVRPLYLDEEKVRFVDINQRLTEAEENAKITLRRKLNKQKQGIVDAYIEATRKGRKAIQATKIQLQEEASYSEELLALAIGLMEFGKLTSANELNKSVPNTTKQQRQNVVDSVEAAITDQETRLQLRLGTTANNALEANLPENQLRILLEQDYVSFFDTVLVPTIGSIFPRSLNQGRQITFDKYGDDIFAFRYSAVLDSRTTDYCRELDGRIFQSTDPDFYMLTPPNHFNCRSVWTPITQEEAEQQQVRVEGKPADLPVYGNLSSFKDITSSEEDAIELQIKEILGINDE